jgi:hypothetical protein
VGTGLRRDRTESGRARRGVTDNTLDGFSFECVHSLISRVSAICMRR